jgi:hypothetical protein
MNSIKWYNSLNIHVRISLKGMFKQICGLSWEEMNIFMFTYKEKINMLHEKLLLQDLIK